VGNMIPAHSTLIFDVKLLSFHWDEFDEIL
jgi:FKBP-type peptidyl-prolyl cis-trans isomerase